MLNVKLIEHVKHYIFVLALCRLSCSHQPLPAFTTAMFAFQNRGTWEQGYTRMLTSCIQLVQACQRSITPSPIPRLPHNSLGMRLCATPTAAPANKIKPAGIQLSSKCMYQCIPVFMNNQQVTTGCLAELLLTTEIRPAT